MVVIYYYLERANYKVWKFRRNSSSYFKTSASLFKALHKILSICLSFYLLNIQEKCKPNLTLSITITGKEKKLT